MKTKNALQVSPNHKSPPRTAPHYGERDRSNIPTQTEKEKAMLASEFTAPLRLRDYFAHKVADYKAEWRLTLERYKKTIAPRESTSRAQEEHGANQPR